MLALALLAGTARAEDRTYVVQRNDTLTGLARRHGLTAAQLAGRNGLTKNARLYVGQHLIIPSRSSLKAPSRLVLDRNTQTAVDAARVAPERWKYIVIHHSGVNEGTMKSMDRYHREERRMENGLAYHFVIGNGNGMGDGEIGVGRRWREQINGGHLASERQNAFSLGICLVGNFDERRPSARQMESLTALTEALLKRCKLSSNAVKTHQQINVVKTRCPGRYFPAESFVRGLNAKR